jgi:hypothetical protein
MGTVLFVVIAIWGGHEVRIDVEPQTQAACLAKAAELRQGWIQATCRMEVTSDNS